MASSKASPTRPAKWQKTQMLSHNTDSDESDSDNISVDEASSTPWVVEYERYINTNDIIPSGMTVIAWWGVCYVFEDLFLR